MQDVLAKHLVIWHNLQDHFKRTMSIMDYTAVWWKFSNINSYTFLRWALFLTMRWQTHQKVKVDHYKFVVSFQLQLSLGCTLNHALMFVVLNCFLICDCHAHQTFLDYWYPLTLFAILHLLYLNTLPLRILFHEYNLYKRKKM